MECTAASIFSRCPNAETRMYPSQFFPKPEPGVVTTWAFSRSSSKNCHDERFGDDAPPEADAGEARRFRKTLYLDSAPLCSLDLINTFRERCVVDVFRVRRIEDEYRLMRERVVNELFHLFPRRHGTRRVIGTAEENNIRVLRRRSRNEAVFRDRIHEDDAATGHHARVAIDRIDRVINRHDALVREYRKDIGAIGFGPVAHEHFARVDSNTALRVAPRDSF